MNLFGEQVSFIAGEAQFGHGDFIVRDRYHPTPTGTPEIQTCPHQRDERRRRDDRGDPAELGEPE